MVANWDSIDKAEAVFQQMVALVNESGGLRIDEAERSLFDMALRTCGHMLQAFIDKAGDGDLGETVQRDGKTLRRSTDKKARVYRSISGVLTVDRYVYAAAAKKAAWTPVDAELGLPAGEQSYVLEDWMQRMCLKESFREGTGSLRDLLGVNTSVRAAERMNRHMAEYVASFQESQPPPDEETEEEILVLAADGKGVPMRRPLEARLQEHKAKQQETEQQEPEQPGTQPQETGADAGSQAATQEKTKKKTKKKRLGRGEKQTRKQMAYVAAVYSIAAFTRTAGQVVDDLRRQQRQADRPRPQHKQVFAEMTRFREGEVLNGQQRCFARLAWSAIRRAAGRTIVCLMDGQRSLWNLKESWFPRAVGILDIFHVMERLWQIAHAFHGDGSAEAEQQVSRHLRLLLEGKVSCLIGVYQREITRRKLTGGRAATVTENIGYFRNNKQYMRYDEYLAAGYPIGTGVVEGACRHFVKDRMEMAGMRWEIEGAQAMLSLRALYLNDQWDAFIEHRIQTEQNALYGQAA